jgi:hypothetical protein
MHVRWERAVTEGMQTGRLEDAFRVIRLERGAAGAWTR